VFRRYLSWRRFRSPSTTLTRMASHPAVVYALLSDPHALDRIIGSDKAQQILWSRTSTDEPGVEHVLALLADQPERLAELLGDPEVQDKLIATGLTLRADLGWLRQAAAVVDPRVVDVLLDDPSTPEALMLEGPKRSMLVEYLASPRNRSARLRALLDDIDARAPGTVQRAVGETRTVRASEGRR
jgi:hypothetical protein